MNDTCIKILISLHWYGARVRPLPAHCLEIQVEFNWRMDWLMCMVYLHFLWDAVPLYWPFLCYVGEVMLGLYSTVYIFGNPWMTGQWLRSLFLTVSLFESSHLHIIYFLTFLHPNISFKNNKKRWKHWKRKKLPSQLYSVSSQWNILHESFLHSFLAISFLLSHLCSSIPPLLYSLFSTFQLLQFTSSHNTTPPTFPVYSLGWVGWLLITNEPQIMDLNDLMMMIDWMCPMTDNVKWLGTCLSLFDSFRSSLCGWICS